MVDKQIISEWLKKADEDYLFAEKHLKDEESFFAPLCFHCHQSAEKYLKAYLIARGWGLKKTHDLIILLSHAVTYEQSLTILSEEVKRLNAYYIETRYPTVWPNTTERVDAERALADVSHIREAIKNLLT
jgi:HEPN domain-containing protein